MVATQESAVCTHKLLKQKLFLKKVQVPGTRVCTAVLVLYIPWYLTQVLKVQFMYQSREHVHIHDRSVQINK